MTDAGENKLRNEFNCICMYDNCRQIISCKHLLQTNVVKLYWLLYKDRRAGKLAVSLTQEFTPILYACCIHVYLCTWDLRNPCVSGSADIKSSATDERNDQRACCRAAYKCTGGPLFSESPFWALCQIHFTVRWNRAMEISCDASKNQIYQSIPRQTTNVITC